jgi:hypothetical protein
VVAKSGSTLSYVKPCDHRYNGLQLCNHINGSFPVVDGTLEKWTAMRREIAPMKLMWWNNPVRATPSAAVRRPS